MSDVSQQEDLSKLTGPKWWYGVGAICFLAMLVGVAILKPWPTHPTAVVLFAMFLLWGTACFFVAWTTYNHVGRKVRWWKDEDRLRVTAQKYPPAAKGLVIEVQVKARPSFTLRWGGGGWCEDQQGGSGYISFVSCSDSRLSLPADRNALNAVGLTQEVIDFLVNARRTWTVVPLDAGRVLRFVDQLGAGIEMHFGQFDGVDLEEILKSDTCARYHKRMQDKARIHDIAMTLAGEVMMRMGLAAPPCVLPLVHRIGKMEDEGVKVRAYYARAVDILCAVLPTLRDAVKRAGRTPTRIEAMRRLCRVLMYLHDHLPKENELRAQLNISEESQLAALRDLDAEEVKSAVATGVLAGGGG